MYEMEFIVDGRINFPHYSHWQCTNEESTDYGRLYVLMKDHWHNQGITAIPIPDNCCESMNNHQNECDDKCLFNVTRVD